MIIMKIVC